MSNKDPGVRGLIPIFRDWKYIYIYIYFVFILVHFLHPLALHIHIFVKSIKENPTDPQAFSIFLETEKQQKNCSNNYTFNK